MKTYNRALDYMALALVQASKGRPQTAAALFIKASTSPDMQQAVAIIEASNAQAYELKAKAATQQKAAAVNAEKKQLAALIGEVPEDEFGGDEVEATPLEDTESPAEPVGEPEVVEDESIGDEDRAEAEQFANALRAAVKKQGTAAAAKSAPKKK
jgi:spore germination protein YaaH